MDLSQDKIQTKMGAIYLVGSSKGLRSLSWDKSTLPTKFQGSSEDFKKSKEIIEEAKKQLQEYFLGKREKFDLKLDLIGSDFQKQVWQELLRIPYGETRSYKDIAKKIQNIRAVRAVGGANGKNPVCIIVPCHRVIRADGNLGGFSAGIERKIELFQIEKISIEKSYC